MRTIEKNIYYLCEEIDELKEQVSHWKKMYEEEKDTNIKQTNERLEETKKGVANALMFALSVKDNPDGSLSISKQDRKELSKCYKLEGVV